MLSLLGFSIWGTWIGSQFHDAHTSQSLDIESQNRYFLDILVCMSAVHVLCIRFSSDLSILVPIWERIRSEVIPEVILVELFSAIRPVIPSKHHFFVLQMSCHLWRIQTDFQRILQIWVLGAIPHQLRAPAKWSISH